MKVKIAIYSSLLALLFNPIIGQQTINESMHHGGLLREYIVYIPAIYDGSSSVPLMFNFHGYTMTAHGQMTWGGDMRHVADTAGFILVYPQGSLFWGETHWNVGSWTAGSIADDLGFTEAMIDALATNYKIDLNRVYSCGYSNGGYFSFELACQLSGRIAAIGSVAGTMSTETYNACNPIHPTPVVTIHGNADPSVSYYGGKPVNSESMATVNSYWANYNNTDAEAVVSLLPDINTEDGSTVELSEYINGDSGTSVKHYKVINGRHDWPGAWGNLDMDAGAVIWEFVSQYDINGLIAGGTTSIKEKKADHDEIHLYPNPAADFVEVEMNFSEYVPYQIFSTDGKPIASGTIDSNNRRIDISFLTSNVYLLRLGNRTVKFLKTD